MEKRSRLSYSLINSFVSTTAQIITVLIGFFLQSVFIKSLGATYLGVKGLFSNILTVLSFTELGIGTAITFSLYKPLAEDNKHVVSLVMHFFKRAYEIIGVVVGVLGILIIPFIHLMIHKSVPHIYLFYILYLTNTVISYFYTYKRTLLNADQKNYINQINQITFRIIQSVLQLVVLYLFKSFLWFLIIQLACTFISNVLISVKVNKMYPYLLDKKLYDGKLPEYTKDEIIKNTIGSVGSKIGIIVVDSTDNVLISFFKGLYWVGLYSNYMLVVNNLINVFGQALGAVTASVGNLNAESDDRDYQYEIFNRCFYIDYFCTFVCSTCLLTLFNPFISVWVGARYRFNFLLVFAIVINFVLKGLRQTCFSFIGAYGLYPKDGKKAVIESIVNFVLSIIYIKYCNLGVLGVVLGTVSSNVLVNWYEPYMVIKYGIRLPNKLKNFFFKLLGYIGINIVVMLVFSKYIPMIMPVHNFGELFILAVITFVLSVLVFIILFGRNKDFKALIEMLNVFISKLKKDKKLL